MNKFSICCALLLSATLLLCTPFILRAYPDMAGKEYPAELLPSAANQIEKPGGNPRQIDDYPQMPGWPLQMGTGFYSPMEGPTQADIDNNGDLEIFAGGGDGYLYGWHHTGAPVSGFPVQTSYPIQSSPSVGDIDGDGDMEILVCNRDLYGTAGDVYAFHSNGSPVAGWPQHTNHGMGINSVGLWDFDNDGALEVFVGSDRLYVWRGNGSSWPGFPATFSGAQYGTCSSSSVGDIDGDGQVEIILEGWDFLNAFELSGTQAAGWPYHLVAGQGFSYSAPSLVDIDNDGNVEIFCGSHGSPNSWLYGLDGDGRMLPGFPQAIAGWTYSTPAIGDLDGDGQVEMALLCNYSLLYVFNTDGTPVPGWPASVGQFCNEAAIAMVDIDGNGQMDMLFGNNGATSTNARYYCYRADGTLHPDFPFVVTSSTNPSCSAIADADGNGTLEIAHHTGDGAVNLWTSPYQAATASRPWPMSHHDAHHTGNYHYGAAYHVTVDLTPAGTPIIIPAIGGNFSFNIAATNRETTPVNFQGWCMVTLPNGSPYGPVLGVLNLTLPAGGSINRNRTQNVPGSAPAGNYVYRAYVGQYPNSVWDEDSFPFTKSATVSGTSVIGDWSNAGASFDEAPTLPVASNLLANFPNPFNPTTAISYQLAANSFVSLKVYDTAGRLVETLVDGWRDAGEHEVTFDGSKLTSGVYIYNLQSGDHTASGKLVLMK